MVEAHHERLQAAFLHQIIERPRAVLATAKWDNTVVVVFFAIGGDQLVKLAFPVAPVDAPLLQFLTTAYVAYTGIVENDGGVRLGKIASGAAFHFCSLLHGAKPSGPLRRIDH